MKSAILVAAALLIGTLFGSCLPACAQASGGVGCATAEKASPELYVFDFFSVVSGDCADIKPVVQKAQRRFADRVKVIHVDVNNPKNKPFIESVGIQAVPTLLVVNTAGDPLKTLAGREQSNVLMILLETLLPERNPQQQALMDTSHNQSVPVALVRQEGLLDPGT